MHPSVLSWWPLLLAATAAGPAGAQPDPSQDSPPAYRSALEGYQKFDEQPVAAWKDANDTVGRIGGWRAYAREASGEREPAMAAPCHSPAEPAAAKAGGGNPGLSPSAAPQARCAGSPPARGRREMHDGHD